MGTYNGAHLLNLQTVITGSTLIPNFDFDVVFDLSTGIPSLKFVNTSSGTQIGVDVAFSVNGPAGPIHIGDIDVPDVTGPWSEYIIPDNFPVLFDFGVYQIIGYVKTPDGINTEYVREKNVLRPGGCKIGDNTNFGVGKIDYLVKCQEGKIFVSDATSYSYDGATGTPTPRSITMKFPADSTGVHPPDKVVTGYPAANFNIPYNGPNYEILLLSIVTYGTGNGWFVKVLYVTRQIFAVTCNIDLCAIKCAVEEYAQDVQCSPTQQKKDKLNLLNTKLSLLILSIMQPSCGNAPQLVDEIIKLGNFSCNCYIQGAQSGIGSVPPQTCDITLGCLDTLLEALDPKCITDRNTWMAYTPAEKLQAWIDKMCACCSGGGTTDCRPPINITFDQATSFLQWNSLSGAGNWQIRYWVSNPGGSVLPIIFTANAPVLVSGNLWHVDMSTVAFLANTDYEFEITAFCSGGTTSGPVSIVTTPNSSCTAASITSVVIT